MKHAWPIVDTALFVWDLFTLSFNLPVDRPLLSRCQLTVAGRFHLPVQDVLLVLGRTFPCPQFATAGRSFAHDISPTAGAMYDSAQNEGVARDAPRELEHCARCFSSMKTLWTMFFENENVVYDVFRK